MSRRPPRATRTDTLFPYTTLFRSVLGKCGLIEDAMSLANTRVLHHDFDPTDASDALSFAPELIIVRDRDQRLVLAGQVRGDNVRWCIPVASDYVTEQIVKEVAELRSEAHYEAGRANFSTAQALPFRAPSML